MSFKLREYREPDFTQEMFVNAPDASYGVVEKDGVAPEHYHAMSIYPEYFKINGKWILAEESRMDCVPVIKDDEGPSIIIKGSIQQEDLTRALNDTLDQMDLTEIFRAVHSKIAEYTFFLSEHGTFSRIDHILGHK